MVISVRVLPIFPTITTGGGLGSMWRTSSWAVVKHLGGSRLVTIPLALARTIRNYIPFARLFLASNVRISQSVRSYTTWPYKLLISRALLVPRHLACPRLLLHSLVFGFCFKLLCFAFERLYWHPWFTSSSTHSVTCNDFALALLSTTSTKAFADPHQERIKTANASG
eukprot:4635937-Pleurochrysis_carterae.AAC.3